MSNNYKVNNYILDNNQMQLILNDCNSMIIAGAGSGKTLTILGKINYLIENNITNPENILLLSFTNASVNDLKNKLEYNLDVFTFHKLAMDILEKNNYIYSICNSKTLSYIISEYIQTCDINDQKIIMEFLKLNIKFKYFIKSNHFFSFCKLIETFINLYKTNNFQKEDIFKRKYTNIEKKILIIIFKIYNQYIEEKKSTNSLDFDDLIIIATKLVMNTKLNYKYIIIDEFQDTSCIRLNLVKKIFNKGNSKIIVVGDDWQSIYQFSGCNLNLYLNFSKIFPNVNIIKITNTYRNSQELIKIATEFIQKNPNQIKKELISEKHSNAPLILVPYYTNKITTFKKLLDKILCNNKNILILSRNNNDIYDYVDDNFIIKNDYIIYKEFEIKYLTIHKSKGLEADEVIILNCDNSYLGFPNKIENNKIIDKLFTKENISYAEERRLFYVAITRCKEKTYLIYNKNNPSIFIKEIKGIIKKNMSEVMYFK